MALCAQEWTAAGRDSAAQAQQQKQKHTWRAVSAALRGNRCRDGGRQDENWIAISAGMRGNNAASRQCINVQSRAYRCTSGGG